MELVNIKEIGKIATRIFQRVLRITGNVDVDKNGTLQAQIDKKADKSITKSATLLASAWAGTEAPYIIRLNLEEATETNLINVFPPPNLHELEEIEEAMCNADIRGGKQGVGWFEMVAYDEKPTIDLPVILIIRGD